MEYVVRYGILPSDIIYNYCHPFYFGEEATEKHIKKLNGICEFFDKLEESILKDGFILPIIIVAGKENLVNVEYLPQHMKDDYKKILFCNSFGGSRLIIAKKHKLDIPCLISDFVDRFPEFETMTRVQEIEKYFDEYIPWKLMLLPNGLYVKNVPHMHLGHKVHLDRAKHPV